MKFYHLSVIIYLLYMKIYETIFNINPSDSNFHGRERKEKKGIGNEL